MLPKLLPYILAQKRMILLSLLCSLGVSGATLSMPWLVKVLLQDALIRKDVKTLYLCIFTGAILALLLAFSRWGFEFFANCFCQKVVYTLRNDAFKKLLGLPLFYFSKKKKGQIISHLTYDIETLEKKLPEVVFGVAKDPFIIVGGVFLLFYIEWRLSILSLFVAPLILLLIKKMAKRMKKLSDKVQHQMGELVGVIEESIKGMQTIKIFSQEDRRKNFFYEQNLAYLRLFIRAAKILFSSSPLAELMCTIGVLAIIWYGGRLVIKEMLLPSELIAFILYITTISLPARKLAKISLLFQQIKAAGERIFSLMEEKEEKMAGGIILQKKIEGRVKIDGVYFGYKEEYVLEDINIEIPAGSTIAIVGPNGAGKTTLAALLLKFYEPKKGNIYIDEYNIKDLEPKSLRAQVLAVPQENVMFSATLRENILMGEKVDEKRFQEVIRICKIDDFADSLPSGYDTVIGDGGVKLSEGQVQKVAIARALIREPRILILDEATAFLDPESEAFLRDGIERILKSQTTIIIAQRLSMAKIADKIFVLDKGRVVEEGRHEELIKKEGLYKRLYTHYKS